MVPGLGKFHQDQRFHFWAPAHEFSNCGIPGQIGEERAALAGLSMLVCAGGLFGAVVYAGGAWKVLLPAAAFTACVALELLGAPSGLPGGVAALAAD